MAMIISYMDESADKKPEGTFVVGGLLGRPVAFFELERRWEQLRKRSDIGIRYFKASECNLGIGQFAKFVADPRNITPDERARLDSISHEFLSLITKPVMLDNRAYICVQGVGVVQDDFYDVITDPKARAVLGPSPYRLAYDFALIQCAWAMKQLGEAYWVSFVCDEDEEHSPFAIEAYNNLKETNPVAAAYMGSFVSDDDKKCEQLQAADAAAYEVRRALNLSLKKWEGELRKQFNRMADTRAVAIITHTTREQLLHIVNNHKPGEPFKLDTLMEMHQAEDIRITL